MRSTGVGYAKCVVFSRVREDWEGALVQRVSWGNKIKGDEEVCVDLGGEVVADCCEEAGGETDKRHERRQDDSLDNQGEDGSEDGTGTSGTNAGDGSEGGEGERDGDNRPKAPPPPPPPRACKIPKDKRTAWDACLARYSTYGVCTDDPRISSASRARAGLGLLLVAAAVGALV